MADLTTLVVDYGGVLTNPLWPVIAEGCVAMGLEPDAFLTVASAGGEQAEVFHAYERGEISPSDFASRLSGWLGVEIVDTNDLLRTMEPDLRMFAAVGAARRQGVTTVLLSNSWGTALYRHDLIAQGFDHVLISGDISMRKPEPRIYEETLRRAGAQGSECVFVDDTAVNFPPAEALGIVSVHHVDAATTIAELERLFELSLKA
jgi:epoxide hydrolase-like predicted phosphatase